MEDQIPTTPPITEPDWTQGPAKWIAVVILGSASIFGMVWSIGPWRGAHPPAHPSLQSSSQPPAVPAQTHAKQEPSAGVPDAPPTSAPRPSTDSTIINLNTATQAQLELLPGIGPSLASRIVEYRNEHGSFASVDELDRVKGIGSRTLERIRKLVKVGD